MNPSFTTIVLLLSCSQLLACGKDKEASQQGKETGAAATTKAPIFSGTLTPAVLTGATKSVNPFDLWEAGFPKLQSQMGTPTFIDGAKHYWAAMDGDSCTFVYVEKDNEKNFHKDKPNPQDMIGAVQAATTVNKDAGKEWTICTKAAGVKQSSLEDENAPVPSEDGIATIENFREGIAAAPSKWAGKKLTISGVVLSTSKSGEGDSATTNLSIRTTKESKKSLGCQLSSPTQADGLKQYSPVQITGTANDTFGGSLSDCSVVSN